MTEPIRRRVVCVLCGRTFRGTLLTWPWSQDPAERWRIPWHKRPSKFNGVTEPCPGRWRLDHRRFDTHRQAS